MKRTHVWLLEHPGVSLQIDLQASALTLPDGTAVKFPIDAFARYCLLNGIDELGFLLQQAEAIARYEQTHAKRNSWMRGIKAQIVVLGGDGIGPEVTHEGVRVLEAIASRYGHEFNFDEHLIGGAAIDAMQTALPTQTISACGTADAVLLGAVGGPKWSDPNAKVRPEQGLLAIRKALNLFANLRPVTFHPALLDVSPLKPEVLRGTDIVVVRELTGGIYFGEKQRTERVRERPVHLHASRKFSVSRVSRASSRRDAASRIVSVDKANVLETSRLWRSTVESLLKCRVSRTSSSSTCSSTPPRCI